jgi:hypothetical protein
MPMALTCPTNKHPLKVIAHKGNKFGLFKQKTGDMRRKARSGPKFLRSNLLQ